MKRVMALLLAVMLTGCSQIQASPILPAQPAALPLALAVSGDRDGEMVDTLAVFGRAVEELSQRQLRVEITYTDDPLATLGEGSDLCLLSTDRLAQADSRLSMTVQPFFWRGYDHFTAALNRPDNLERAGVLLGESLRARPLGVYYRETINLMSTRKVNDNRGLGTFNMTLAPGAWDSYAVFEPQVSTIRFYTRPDELVESLRSKEVRLVEADHEMARYLGEKVGRIYAVPSGHYIKGDWLLLSEGAAQTLDETQLAVLREAMAQSLADNDHRRLDIDAALWGNTDDTITLMTGDFERLKAAGEAQLSNRVIPNHTWSRELLAAYRMGVSLATEVPVLDEDSEDEDEDEPDSWEESTDLNSSSPDVDLAEPLPEDGTVIA